MCSHISNSMIEPECTPNHFVDVFLEWIEMFHISETWEKTPQKINNNKRKKKPKQK